MSEAPDEDPLLTALLGLDAPLDLSAAFGLMTAVAQQASSASDMPQLARRLRPYVPPVQAVAGLADQLLPTALGVRGRGDVAVVYKAAGELLLLAGHAAEAAPRLRAARELLSEVHEAGLMDVQHLVVMCDQLLSLTGESAPKPAPAVASALAPEHPLAPPALEDSLELGRGYCLYRGVLEGLIDPAAVGELAQRRREIFRATIRNDPLARTAGKQTAGARCQNRLEGEPCNLPEASAAMQVRILAKLRELTGFTAAEYELQPFLLLSSPGLEQQALHVDNLWRHTDRRGASLFWPLNRPASYAVVPGSHRTENASRDTPVELLQLEPGDVLVIHPMLAHAGGAFMPGYTGCDDEQCSIRGFGFADLRWMLGGRRSPNQASQWWPICAGL